jgi:hypothetical protein
MSSRHMWLFELHGGSCHVRQLAVKKDYVVPEEEQTEPLFFGVCDGEGVFLMMFLFVGCL